MLLGASALARPVLASVLAPLGNDDACGRVPPGRCCPVPAGSRGTAVPGSPVPGAEFDSLAWRCFRWACAAASTSSEGFLTYARFRVPPTPLRLALSAPAARGPAVGGVVLGPVADGATVAPPPARRRGGILLSVRATGLPRLASPLPLPHTRHTCASLGRRGGGGALRKRGGGGGGARGNAARSSLEVATIAHVAFPSGAHRRASPAQGGALRPFTSMRPFPWCRPLAQAGLGPTPFGHRWNAPFSAPGNARGPGGIGAGRTASPSPARLEPWRQPSRPELSTLC